MKRVPVKTTDELVAALQAGDATIVVAEIMRHDVIIKRWLKNERFHVGSKVTAALKDITFGGSQVQILEQSDINLSDFRAMSAYGEEMNGVDAWFERGKGGGVRSLCLLTSKNVVIENAMCGYADDESFSVSDGCENIRASKCQFDNGAIKGIIYDAATGLPRADQLPTIERLWKETRGADMETYRAAYNQMINEFKVQLTTYGKGNLIYDSHKVTVEDSVFRNISGRCPSIANVTDFTFQGNKVYRHSWQRFGELKNVTGKFCNNRFYNVDKYATSVSYTQPWFDIVDCPNLVFCNNFIDGKPATKEDFMKIPGH